MDYLVVDPDFRNTYSIIGFCGINIGTAPSDYYVNEGTNCSDHFVEAVELSLAKGILRDAVLVLDNAAIHRFGDVVGRSAAAGRVGVRV